jgi:hypothetical protein
MRHTLRLALVALASLVLVTALAVGVAAAAGATHVSSARPIAGVCGGTPLPC